MSDPYNAIITTVEPAPALPGPLHGRRLLVKDLIDTARIRTTYGSRIYADHVPVRTATAVERLVAAGAVVVGTNLDNPDFAALARAFGAHGETVERTDEFAPALERALDAGKPAVLHLLIDPEAINPRTTLSAIRAGA